ncbi:MAG: hypothetical protein RR942_13470 [Romboutsia sp.]
MESIKLDNIIVNENRVDYIFSTSKGLEKYFNKPNNLFINYDVDISEIPKSILAIPFISIVLPIIWSTNSILWIEEVDRTYYDSIHNIKRAYQEMYPHFPLRGTVVPAKTIYNAYTVEREVIQLFTGGIDSSCTFIRNKDKNPILVNIYGWFDDKVKDNKVFDGDKKDIRLFSENQGNQCNFVGSNFCTFIKNNIFNKDFQKKIGETLWFGFQHSMAFISITIPLAYMYKCRNIFIASSNTLGYRKCNASDPTTDIEFKFATVGGVVHDGFELTRQDKSSVISRYQEESKEDYFLRVCSFNDENCCECEKCFRTILGLVAEGSDIERFGFNISTDLKSHFKRVMEQKIHLMGLEMENDIYWDEIKNRMMEEKYRLEYKEFVEWFMNYDFIEERKRGVRKYRLENFIPLVKKKIKEVWE